MQDQPVVGMLQEGGRDHLEQFVLKFLGWLSLGAHLFLRA